MRRFHNSPWTFMDISIFRRGSRFRIAIFLPCHRMSMNSLSISSGIPRRPPSSSYRSPTPDPLPSYTRIRCDASEASRTSPIELHTDNLVVCEDGAKAVLAVITESQRRKEAKKKYTWPEYVTILRARLRCPVKLLVLVPNQRIADWCGAPIALGCGEIRPIPLVMSALRPLT